MENLVYIDEHGLLGSNFYWHQYDSKALTDEELKEAGLTSDRVQVDKSIIGHLVEIDKEFQKRGFRLYIKEGYRSKALYEIIYRKRVEMVGKEETDRLLNMKDMPHATGKSIDVALWDKEKGEFAPLRKKEDGIEALFVDFYKNKLDEQSKTFQELQEHIISIMQSHGFDLGTKNEYFHFNYSLTGILPL